jgi:hypothetical protein
MTTEVLVPSIGYGLTALAPYVLQSCVLAPPPPAPAPQPEEAIFTPVPPGIEYESLPVLDPVTQIIDTSPSQIIGCANALPDGGEQGTLNALFPDAVDGDGVVNRQNNDIWKYDGTTWENVGPTPGPQVVVVSVLPPWNEIAIYDARIRTRLQVVALDYALALLTEPDPIGVVLGLDVARVMPVTNFALAVHAPAVLTDVGLQIPVTNLNFRARRPYAQNLKLNIPLTSFQFTATTPYANRLRLQIPVAGLTITAQPPALFIPVDVSGITYAQSSVWSGSTAASNAIMTDGSFTNTGAATDIGNPAWIRMDLGFSTKVSTIVVGTATSNIPGGWNRSYTENRNLQYSNDAVAWTTATSTGTFAANGIYTFAVSFKARYIRIATTSNDYAAISEFYALSPGQSYP